MGAILVGEGFSDRLLGDGMPFYQGKSEFGDVFLGSPTKWTREVTKTARPNDILMSVRAPVGPVNITQSDICIGRGLAAIRANDGKVDHWYLFYVLRHLEPRIKGNAGVTFPSINKEDIEHLEIPLPPLDVQRQIVAELDGYRKVIEGARQVVANYKPAIRIDPAWPRVELVSISAMKRGPFGGSLKKEIFVGQGYKVYEQKHAIQRDVAIGRYFVDEKKYKEMAEFAVAPGDIIVSCSGTMGCVYLLPSNAPAGIINQALLKITPDQEKVIGKYLEFILGSDSIQKTYFRDTNGATIQNVASMIVLKAIPVPLPPLNIQQEIISQLETERALVDANRKLVEIFEQKSQDKLAEIWGEAGQAA